MKTDWRKVMKKTGPELLAVLLCLVLLWCWISRKEGYHMDELLSFELSNARYNPWIVPTQPEGRLAKFVREEIQGDSVGETLSNLTATVSDVLHNKRNSKLLSYTADVYDEPVWISAEQFTDYVTVDQTDAFDYLSVYFNVKDDNHPPVHFMLLHTVSSLFQGKLAPVMGCGLNLIFLGITLWLLLRLGRQLAVALGREEQGQLLGILAVLLYGLSTGALATVLLIRMYCLLSCLCVALFSIHLQKWQERGFGSHNKGLIAVTVLGFLTQYFFLFYCILLAAVTAVVLLTGKRTKELFCYIRSMVIAAVIGLGLFPFAISDVFSSGRGTEALGNLASGLRGYGQRILAFGEIVVRRTVGGYGWVAVLLVAAVLLVLGLCERVRKGVKTAGEAEKIAETAVTGGRREVAALFIIPVIGYFLLAARMSPYMVDRYIMPLFPFLALGIALLLVMAEEELTARTGWKRRIVTVGLLAVVVLVQIAGYVTYDGEYLYEGYAAQEQIAAENAGLPCICVYTGVGYYENLPEFMQYTKTLLVTEEELADRQDSASLTACDEAVLLLKPGVDTQVVFRVLAEKYGMQMERALLTDGVHGDSIYVVTREK